MNTVWTQDCCNAATMRERKILNLFDLLYVFILIRKTSRTIRIQRIKKTIKKIQNALIFSLLEYLVAMPKLGRLCKG